MTAHTKDDIVSALWTALHGDPQLPWLVMGDMDSCAEALYAAIADRIGPPSVAPEPPAPIYVLGRRPFTSDDAAAITALAVVAPVIGAAIAVVHRIRRGRQAVTS